MTVEQPTPPVVLPPVWENIPASLAQRQQWVLWKFEWDVKRECWLKVPYYAMGGRRAGGQGEDSDRMRLATLEVVRRVFDKRPDAWAGVGFGFLPGDGLIGIDLDKQVDPATGAMSDRCRNIIDAFATYTETSPSGTGVHLYVLGHTTTAKSNDIGVEMFCDKQYFTVTGHHVPGTPLEVVQANEAALRRMHVTIQEAKDKHKRAAAPPKPAPPAQPAASGTDTGQQGDGKPDFRKVNDAAMAALHAWVPALFGGRELVKGDGYRVTSKALGRDLQEDLSIAPNGIVDFGVADMGDARGGARTPVDLVMEWGLGMSKPADALRWLAKTLGVTLSKPPPKAPKAPKPPTANVPAPAGADGGDGDGGMPSDGYDPDWAMALGAKLVLHRGRPMDCRENVLYCLELDPTLRQLVRKNDFSHLLERSREAPWGRVAGEWDEEDDLMLGEYLLRKHGLSVKGKSTLRDGVLMAARLFRYNPIIDWIKAEPWDGIERLEHWLTDVYEVEDRPYTRLIGKCFFMGLVKRAIEPGCKFDYMMIIKGEQGLQKSAAWRVLAFPYFTDNAIRIGDKDSQMAQQLAWVVESAELESLNKSETTLIKQHLSAQEDWYRPPYGSQMIKAPRHSVHVGTTNADTFLKDATGDRRMWPLEVFAVNLEVLRGMRLQLLAEALHRVEKGERYWPNRDEEKTLIFPEHEPFKKTDPWEDMLGEYVNGDLSKKMGESAPKSMKFFASTQLYEALGIKADRIDGNGQMDTRISNAMKALGFTRHRETGGKRRRGYMRGEAKDAPAGAQPVPAPTPVQPAAGRFDALLSDREDDALPF